MCESYREMMFQKSMFMSRVRDLNGDSGTDDVSRLYNQLIQACGKWEERHEKTCDLCKVLVG